MACVVAGLLANYDYPHGWELMLGLSGVRSLLLAPAPSCQSKHIDSGFTPTRVEGARGSSVLRNALRDRVAAMAGKAQEPGLGDRGASASAAGQ